MMKRIYKNAFASAVIIIILLSLFTTLLVVWVMSIGAASNGFLLIDHDGGADDAMAISLALMYEKYFNGPKVIALTTVHGNVNEPQAFINSQRILNIAKSLDVPIYRGTESALIKGIDQDNYFGRDGLGDNATGEFIPIAAREEHAALALINLSKQYEGRLSIIALGALTNIALAIKLDNGFINRLSQLYVAAGNINSKMYPDAEFNAQMDVEAYYIVTAAGLPDKLTIIPFSEIKKYIKISNDWRIQNLGSIKTEMMRSLNKFEQVSLPKSTSWVLLDPAAMAVALIKPSFVKNTRYSYNSINLCGTKRGVNKNIFTSKQNVTANIVTVVDEEQYKKFLIEVFSAPLS